VDDHANQRSQQWHDHDCHSNQRDLDWPRFCHLFLIAMAITTNNPISRDGNTYGLLVANLALSPMVQSSGFGASIAVRLTPYLLGPNGPERLEDQARSLSYGDATVEAARDPAVAAFLQALEAAAQAFIDAKGL